MPRNERILLLFYFKMIGSDLGFAIEDVHIIAKQSFINGKNAGDFEKVLRSDDRTEEIFGNNMRANEQITDELATIKPAIRLLIIDVISRFDQTFYVIFEVFAICNEILDNVGNDRITFIRNGEFENIATRVLEALERPEERVLLNETAGKDVIRIAATERIHFGKIFAQRNGNMIIGIPCKASNHIGNGRSGVCHNQKYFPHTPL